MSRRLRRIALLVLAAGVTGTAVGTTLATFSASTTTSGPTFSVKRVFSGARALSAWSVSDAADGSASDESDVLSYADSVFHTTKAMSTTWSTSRYIEFEFAGAAPAGVDAGTVTFDLDFSDAGGGGGETTCVWLEIRRRSTGAVLGTRGSTSSPFACETAAVMTSTSADITAEVPDGTVANDLAIRLYVQNSSAGKSGRIDRARVRFTRYGHTWTLHRTRMVDASDGTATASDWGLVAADGAYLQTAGNWSSSYSATRFVDFEIPANVPTGATVTSATLRHRYRSATAGETACWGAQAISGGTVIATYGTVTTPVGCNATGSFVTDTVAMPEVDTGGEAGDLTIRVYMTVTGNRSSQHDLLEVSLDYSLPGTGCVAPGTTTVTSTRDSWADQNAPTNTGGGNDTEGRVKTQDGNRNRRAYVYFPLPSAPEGCALTGATLRLYGSGVQNAGTRTIEAYRAGSAWTETGLSWSTAPAPAGTAATTTNLTGWREWDVLGHVQAMYGGSNDGFVIKDAAESAASASEQRYQLREGANPPQLAVTFG